MSATDLMILAIVALLVMGALLYIRKSRKAGKRCAGCPDSGGCTKSCCCDRSNSKMQSNNN